MHEPVLVLNANFEPLNVCQTRRAITLVLLGKASLVLNGRGVIHTVRRAYPRPSVIRLERMIRRPRPQVKLNRREIFRRDNYTCQYCGKTSHRLTVDHVVPRRLGGESTWKNLVTACPICNHKKGGRTLQHARMRLLRTPQTPPSSAKYRFAHLLDRNREWEPFLDGW